MATTRFPGNGDDRLDALYADLAAADIQPLWELEGVLTPEPRPRAVPFVWRGKQLREFAERAGELVTTDRRVLSLANPGLGGEPYAVPTLWAGVQYLNGHEVAPAHHHSPAALRFVIAGSGVFTLVNGDPVAMGPGDLVLTPNWAWHEHHNTGAEPMAWIDGLDVPLVRYLDAVFFEPGGSEVPSGTAERSRSERLYGAAAGIVPVDFPPHTASHSALVVYRWADTDRALRAQDGFDGDRAAVRFVDPTSGRDIMPTLRCEVHRYSVGNQPVSRRQVGSSVGVVFRGAGTVRLGDTDHDVMAGDIFAVPSWTEVSVTAHEDLDLFVYSDAPVLEALSLFRESRSATHRM